VFEALEKPLPRDARYAEARLIEAALEGVLALEFLRRGLVRNAAGKAFQAWRAVLAALLRLELDKLKTLAKTEEERRWLEERAVFLVPTTKMVPLSQLLEEAGHEGILSDTSLALDLHDYQYHGPDPDMALSKYRTREEAAAAVKVLLRRVAARIGEARLRSAEVEKALKRLEEELSRVA